MSGGGESAGDDDEDDVVVDDDDGGDDEEDAELRVVEEGAVRAGEVDKGERATRGGEEE